MTQDRDQGSDPRPEGNGASNGPTTLRERVRSLRLSGGEAPTPRRAWIPWVVTGVALSLAVLFGFYAYRVAPAKTPPPPADADAAEANGNVSLESKGYVIAAHQFRLSPQSGGEIVWLDPDFKEGELYHKGEVLAVVDPEVYIARRRAAQALLDDAEINLRNLQEGGRPEEIEGARRQVESARASLKLQLDKYDIEQKAGRASTEEEKINTRNDIEKARADLAVAERAVQALENRTVSEIGQGKARIAKAQFDLAEAKKNLDNCVIRAPVDGTVLSKNAELGAYVSPLAYGAAGYLCEMANLSDLEVELDIQERDIARVWAGQVCRIMPEAYQRDDYFLKTHGKDGYRGVVSRVMPQANRAKGAITVRVKVELAAGETPGSYLRPDMGVLVSFLKKG